MSDLQKPKRPKRPTPPDPKPKPRLELVRISPASAPKEQIMEPPPIARETKAAQEPAPEITKEDSPKGLQPIPPPTERLQYRAVGLVDGRFVPEEAEPNKGTLVTGDGQTLSCVILGKMLAIVKRRLQLDRSYLWVVYPRTQTESGDLHLQITGVWAPVELGKSEQPIDPGFPEGQFSIRGEVVQVQPDRFVVKIKRTDAKASSNPALRKFKLKILGVVPPDTVGYFWDMQVRREGTALQLVEGTAIELIPKKPVVRRKSKPGREKRGQTGSVDRPIREKPQRTFDRPVRRLSPKSQS